MEICKAKEDDLAGILDLQRLAYQTEAERLGSYDIPPLRQTLEQMYAEYQKGLFLKAIHENALVGSVRGWMQDGTLYIGKLMVHPVHRRQGLGTRLLLEMEARCPAARYELFTSSESQDNLRLYEQLGYRRCRTEQVSPELTFVYLHKLVAAI